MAKDGPTAAELADAKSYLTGSFALRFDTSSKIASQLVQLQVDDLGIDYIDRRNGLIEAVTLEDVRRAAKRLLDTKMLVAVAGKGQGASGAKRREPRPWRLPPAAAVPSKRDGG